VQRVASAKRRRRGRPIVNEAGQGAIAGIEVPESGEGARAATGAASSRGFRIQIPPAGNVCVAGFSKKADPAKTHSVARSNPLLGRFSGVFFVSEPVPQVEDGRRTHHNHVIHGNTAIEIASDRGRLLRLL